MTRFSLNKWDPLLLALSLVPLMAVSTDFVSGFGIGVTFLLSIILISVTVSGLRFIITLETRIVHILIISATIVTIIHIVMQVCFFELSLRLGIFIPLIAMNCIILVSNEEHSLCNNLIQSLFHGLQTGLFIMFILIMIGLIRELFIMSTLFHDLDLIFGETAITWKIGLANKEGVLPLFGNGFGAFLLLGILIACSNFIKSKSHNLSV